MNAKDKKEIERRMIHMPEPTAEKIKKMEERIQRHREKNGTLENSGIFGNLIKWFH